MSTAELPQTSNGKYKVIGTRPIRHDGVDKVTGRAQYGADLRLQGTLRGAILRSPHAHAKIRSIDTSAAEQLPGVHAVMTSADLPTIEHKVEDLGEGMFDLQDLSRNVLATDKVLYRGHAVAAVAAENIHIAQEAIKLIKVDYEPLPPVLDVRKACKPDAPILHENLRTSGFADAAEPEDRPTNIAKKFLHEKGDIEAGFAEADVVIEREFTTSTVHQGYIEPHTATAMWNADGNLTCWTSTQGSFTVRAQLAGLLEVPLAKIKVVPMEIGGGFGGKISVYLQPVAAVLSRKTGRPVQITMDRIEVLEATGPTPGSWMKVKLGATRDGRLTAGEAEIYFEAGAFPGSPVGAGAMCVFACYDLPHGRVVGYDVCVNKPATKAYRAPGSTQVAFATETVIDEICREIGVDPVEFRIANSAKESTRRVDGPVYSRIGMMESVQAVQTSDHWKSPLDRGESSSEIRRGRGVASGFWFNAGLKSAVSASVNSDGSVSLVEGSTDIGGSRASIAMQLAETIGLQADDIRPAVVDTDSVGYTDVTGGSRVTYATGWAAYEAGLDIRRQFAERAAIIWDVSTDQVEYVDGTWQGPKNQSLTFQEIAAQLNSTGGPVIGHGTSDHDEPGGAFATHVVDVEVDIETGKVQVVRYTATQDVGTAIHPSYVEGQMQGGAVQGIGWALNEEYWYDETGTMKNSSLLDYRMPTCFDLPMIDTIIVEVPNPGHPYGVRGVGEVPIVPPPAAIANAVYDAIGVRMRHLPMSPPHVLHEILKSPVETKNG